MPGRPCARLITRAALSTRGAQKQILISYDPLPPGFGRFKQLRRLGAGTAFRGTVG
jgi:hypothetical protein